MQYAVPKPYYVVENADLQSLRRQLKDAETTAARARDFTTRTRAEQDAKQLRAQVGAAEVHQRAGRANHVAGNHQPPQPVVATNFAAMPFSLLADVMAELRRAGALR